MEETNKIIPIVEQIELMIKENNSSISIDEVLTNLFNKYNITYDTIRLLINDTKCENCVYYTDYNNNMVFLKCNLCNNINNCRTCFNIVKSNNIYIRRNSINKTVECRDCSDKINIDACNICHNILCCCNLPFGC
jgi:hypothetical protein